ncbi:MAG: M23 family metallopeptidase [Patescibacteria group bacterium]
MKTLVSVISLVAILALATMPVAMARDVKFRLPVGGLLNPPISYYYDNDTRASARKYDCTRNRVYNNHRGTDFRTGPNSVPVFAAAPGEISSRLDGCPNVGFLGSACGGGFGNNVRVNHGDGWTTIYAHLKSATGVYPADLLCFGTCPQLGDSGSSGNSSGPHLHFEVRKYAYPNNDPFSGRCSGNVSFWNQMANGMPTTVCM